MNKYIKYLVKYIPIVINAYIALILIGVVNENLYPIFGQSFLLNTLLYLLSIKYKFCAWHRILILSMSFCLLLEFLEIHNIFVFEFINNIKMTITLIGLLIFAAYGTRKS